MRPDRQLRFLVGIIGTSFLWLSSPMAVASEGDVSVHETGGALAIFASGVPLCQILDRLAMATDITLHYDGPRPDGLATVRATGRSAADVVLALLNEQGLNYAVLWNERGDRIRMLLVSAPTPPRADLAAQPDLSEPASRPEEYTVMTATDPADLPGNSHESANETPGTQDDPIAQPAVAQGVQDAPEASPARVSRPSFAVPKSLAPAEP